MASQHQHSNSRLTVGAYCAAIVFAVAVGFREAPFLGFVDYDDPVAVLNPVLREGFSWESLRFAFTEAPINLWHPLTFLTHLVDFELYGTWAGGHHLGNVLIHLASCLLLFVWLRRYSGEDGLSLAVTLLFAIHPLRVESVIWVTERKDVLSLFFYLLTIWFYSAWATATAAPARRRAYVLSLVAAVLGILSKPSLMTLPLILFIVDLWPLGRLRWEDRTNWPLLRQRIVEKIPFAVLALVAAVVAWSTWSGNQFIGEPPNLPFTLRTGFASLAYISYLQRTVVPFGLVPFLSYPMSIAGSAHIMAFIAMGMATVLAFLRLPKSPWFAAGWLWFVVAILPASGLITISDHFAPDRYTYLAHIGLFVVAVWSFAAWGRERRLAPALGWVALALVLIPCFILTHRQSLVWRDPETLWRHALAAKGSNYVAHNQLGLFLLHAGRFDEGVAELQKAMAANPGFPLPIANLARARANQGDLAEAIRLMREAGPDLPMREPFREELLARSIAAGRRDLAAGLWEDILAEAPRDPLKRLAAGEFAYQGGDLPEAMTHYRAALELDPGNASAALNLGALLIKSGALDEAIPVIERSIAHAPDQGAAADAHRTLAQAHLLKRDWAPAIAAYEKGLALAPDRDLLRNELAQLLLDVPESSLRNPERAFVLVEPFGSSQTAKTNPRYLRTLARALQVNGRVDEAKAVAASGLEVVAKLSAQEPLEKPWTTEELDSLANAFRELAGVPVP
jgi:tetratricopeptide (TPR) repeat protein